MAVSNPLTGRRARRGPAVACRGDGAFTLIEVLVVVAIIATLLAILLPSLNRAREQARLVTCTANCKQIATAIAAYRAEENDYVPIIFNYAASVHGTFDPPARECWMSVALRKYDKGTASLAKQYGGQFDPDAVWNDIAILRAYEAQAMPAHYACPFQRDRGAPRETHRDEGLFRYYEKLGRFESVQTWLWENVVPGQLPPHGIPWPAGVGSPGDGVPKYAAFSWNRVRVVDEYRASLADGTLVPQIPGCHDAGTRQSDPSKRAYRQWTQGDARRLRAGGLSAVTIAFCAAGEHVLGAQPDYRIGRANVGSHRTSRGGGTNTVFADTHVEWVRGTQVGWP